MTAATLVRTIPIVHNLDTSKPTEAAALDRVRALVDAARLPIAEDGLTGYARISSDGDGRGLGVERQVEDILTLARYSGEAVARIVVENDESASEYAGRPRELWQLVLAGMRSGQSSHVLATSTSRLTRDLGELNELLKLRRDGASFSTKQGVRMYPTMTAFEVQMVRMAGTQDAAESDLISERTRRAFVQNAAKGTPHGPIAYGWDRHRERGGEVVDTINEAQAAVIREAAARVLAGDTVRGICRDLNARGVPAPRGGQWSTTILTKILKRERNAARRVHQGVVVGPAAWQAVLDDDTFDAVVAVLRDPERRASAGGGAPTRYLLSGLLVCGRCLDSRVWVNLPAAGSNTAPGYQCKSCYGIRRKQAPVDAYVVERIVHRLAEPDALDHFSQDAAALAEARTRLAALQAREAQLGEAFAAGAMSLAQVTAANATLLPEIEAARVAVEAARPLPQAVRSLAELDDPELVRAAWDGLSLDTQRAVVRELVTVTLLPTTRRKFDADAVALDWRTDRDAPVAERRPPVAP